MMCDNHGNGHGETRSLSKRYGGQAYHTPIHHGQNDQGPVTLMRRKRRAGLPTGAVSVVMTL